jgi:hypothetical protein
MGLLFCQVVDFWQVIGKQHNDPLAKSSNALWNVSETFFATTSPVIERCSSSSSVVAADAAPLAVATLVVCRYINPDGIVL